MTRDEWLAQFTDELIKLRPHLSDKVAHTLALQAYSEKVRPVHVGPMHATHQRACIGVAGPHRVRLDLFTACLFRSMCPQTVAAHAQVVAERGCR